MTLPLAQAAQEIDGLKKYAAVTLRDWRWHARHGDHTTDNLQRLREVHEDANEAVAQALAIIAQGDST